MTAPNSKSKDSPQLEKNKSVAGGFVIDQNFLENQTVKVFVRLRPPTEEEVAEDAKSKTSTKRVWNIQKTGAVESLVQKGVARKVDGRTLFNFDQVFDEVTPTPFLYKSVARAMVHTVLNGKHATIFAYGQTGSGKTYTMQGDAESGNAGVIQLVIADLFRFMRMGAQSNRDWVVKVSYVEVYNERVRDLLSDEAMSMASQGTPSRVTPVLANLGPEVQIRTSEKGEITLSCETRVAYTQEEVVELLIMGNTQRVVAKTDKNAHSSRSHAIFRLTVESSEKGLGPGAEIVRVADFNLVDLAGSESMKTANTAGRRQREGAKINQSLLSLSTVISSLSLPPRKRPKHINYRDSKLTRILQPHLQGNAEMAIICCASPTKPALEETRSTLKFGARAKLITVKPQVNELNDDSALIKKLQAELEEAKRQIEEFRRKGVPDDQMIRSGRGFSMSDMEDSMELSYGYDDMDAGPGHREQNLKSNQDCPPPPPGIEEEREKLPGMGGRTYVMPKNQELPPELQGRDYVMPENFEGDFEQRNLPVKEPQDFSSPHEEQSEIDKLLNEKSDSESSDEESTSNLHNSAAFKLDAVDSTADADKTIQRYLQGRSNTASDDEFDSVSDSHANTLKRTQSRDKSASRTGPTEVDSISIDGPVTSHAGVSLTFGDAMSRPDTLRAASTVAGWSMPRTIDSKGNELMDGGNRISWDTLNLNTMHPNQVGKPLKALHTLHRRDEPLPTAITIMRMSGDEDGELCLTDKLHEAEARSAFMLEKLETSDDLVEGVFKDLERARLCIHDLVHRNAQLSAKAKRRKRQDIKEQYEEGEVFIEQYWFLKGSMYVGLFFFITGGYEYFMATTFTIWLVLEMNLRNMA